MQGCIAIASIFKLKNNTIIGRTPNKNLAGVDHYQIMSRERKSIFTMKNNNANNASKQ